MAAIQLRKILAQNSKLIKGYHLLALIQIKNEEWNRARRILKKAARIDKTNTTTLRFLREVDEQTGVTTKLEKKNKKEMCIRDRLKKLGASADWERERFTMDEGCSRAVQEVFIRLYEKGYIYKGSRIINWCPVCQTSISDAEVEHEDQDGDVYKRQA